jgi:hypothetical protein
MGRKKKALEIGPGLDITRWRGGANPLSRLEPSFTIVQEAAHTRDGPVRFCAVLANYAEGQSRPIP